jgi:hypothetical protein
MKPLKVYCKKCKWVSFLGRKCMRIKFTNYNKSYCPIKYYRHIENANRDNRCDFFVETNLFLRIFERKLW